MPYSVTVRVAPSIPITETLARACAGLPDRDSTSPRAKRAAS
jgi:hypothetical protein